MSFLIKLLSIASTRSKRRRIEQQQESTTVYLPDKNQAITTEGMARYGFFSTGTVTSEKYESLEKQAAWILAALRCDKK